MADSLLLTKLIIPSPRFGSIERRHLLDKLNEGVKAGNRLILVSAPAGFGKTTLVSDLLCTGAPQKPIVWITLDEGDNDPGQFLNYLITAIQQVHAKIGQSVQQILQSPQLPPLTSLLTSLINDIAAKASAFVLVLDDYHTISSETVHVIVRFLIERQPPSLQIVLVSREDPPLPLPRLRARGQLTEIRERDLRFSNEEAAAFLSQTMGLHMTDRMATAINTKTEGWIAGLQLAALALKDYQDTPQLQAQVSKITGDNRYIFDYLMAEVLQQQPPAVRDFLCQTVILDQLTASLCNAILEREDSQSMLEQLAASHLFLIALDPQQKWYRYYKLFAEVLRTTLSKEQSQRLHQRAKDWYEAHNRPAQAIQHALACKDWDSARRLIPLAADEIILSGGAVTVRGWLEQLPKEQVWANGELSTCMAWALVMSGEFQQAMSYAETAQVLFNQQGHREPGLGKVLALRSMVALGEGQDPEGIIKLATGALDALQEDQPRWRMIALWALAETLERTQCITKAIETYREAERVGLALGNQFFGAIVESWLASALNDYGQRRQAIQVCQQAIERFTDENDAVAPTAGLLFSRYAMILYEGNQLELARQSHKMAKELCEQLGLEPYITLSQAFSAATVHALGDTPTALEILRRAKQYTHQFGYSTGDWLECSEMSILFSQGNLEAAFAWARKKGLSVDIPIQFIQFEDYLLYSRLLLAQGEHELLRRWLERLEQFARERELNRWLISIHILQALNAEDAGDRAAAIQALSRAVKLAGPENYARAFLNEDRRIFDLLPPIRPADPVFVDRLIQEAAPVSPVMMAKAQKVQPLVEPLSERELEVLRLIALGFSNAEIADKLVIAHGTVKRHINNIYGKLESQSRTQAIAKARMIGLLV